MRWPSELTPRRTRCVPTPRNAEPACHGFVKRSETLQICVGTRNASTSLDLVALRWGAPRPGRSMMKRSVFLSTFLFAAVLSPITLQPYTCGPPPEQARLAVLELRVGSFAGENTIEGFNSNVFSYDVRFPESESVGVLWVKTNHPSTSVDVEYDGMPVRLVGQSVAELEVPLGSSELTIHVARPGLVPDAKTYVVHIQRVPVFAVHRARDSRRDRLRRRAQLLRL